MAPELGGAPRAIVCDCMDELSAFKNAPQQLMQRESALFRMANVVFTGGPSLYRAKSSVSRRSGTR
jgi:UDP-galactopyranose mutase